MFGLWVHSDRTSRFILSAVWGKVAVRAGLLPKKNLDVSISMVILTRLPLGAGLTCWTACSLVVPIHLNRRCVETLIGFGLPTEIRSYWVNKFNTVPRLPAKTLLVENRTALRVSSSSDISAVLGKL
jgi:hypothetical protein